MISIIGAGPAGSYLAYLLAKNGKQVELFEEHKEVGKPVQCAGIMTGHLEEILKLKNNFVLNKISRVKVFSPNKKSVEFKLGKKNIVVDREAFDNHILDLAKEKGAKINLNSKFIDCKPNKVKVHFKIAKKGNLKTDFLVGADGPLSKVAKSAGLFNKRKFLTGMQAIVKGKFDKDCFSVYFGDNIAPDFFAWVIPENEYIARVGLATEKNTTFYFNKFLKTRKVIEKQGGIIPIYDKEIESYKGKIFLVGDAAAHVKATTGGGVIPGLIASRALFRTLVFKNDYKKELLELKRELNLGLKIRQIFNRFTDKDLNELIKLSDNDFIKNFIGEHDREFPSKYKLAFKLFLKEPRLLKFARKAF